METHVSTIALVLFPAHLVPICPLVHLLEDRGWFGEQMSLKLYLDSQNFLLHFSDTRWDNYHGPWRTNPLILFHVCLQ